MLNSWINTQGTIKDIQKRGVFDAQKEEITIVEPKGTTPQEEEVENKDKKPKKLIKDEHCKTGGIKWIIDKSYLKAS